MVSHLRFIAAVAKIADVILIKYIGFSNNHGSQRDIIADGEKQFY